MNRNIFQGLEKTSLYNVSQNNFTTKLHNFQYKVIWEINKVDMFYDQLYISIFKTAVKD